MSESECKRTLEQDVLEFEDAINSRIKLDKYMRKAMALIEKNNKDVLKAKQAQT